MRVEQRRAAFVLSALLCGGQLAQAQTYTTCNPTEQSCPADKALGGSITADFTSGASSDFTSSDGSIEYTSNGAQLTVSGPGDAPTLTSNWYIMFGRVEIVMQTAPGVGMVSSATLQSDDLDEIDWEILGADAASAQTNYFGKGETGAYDRATTVSDATSQSGFNTYTIDWTADALSWSINGATLRTLLPADAAGQYPQTPSRVKVGAWAGGDPSNAPGTIQWAGGNIDYAAGPYTMMVKSIAVTDYSTGTEYSYDGTSGTWQSIVSTGGAIGGGSAASSSGSGSGTGTGGGVASAPGPLSTWDGTHRPASSAYTQTGYPWTTPSGTSSSVTVTDFPNASDLLTSSAPVFGVATPTASLSSPFSALPSGAGASVSRNASTFAYSTGTGVAYPSLSVTPTPYVAGAPAGAAVSRFAVLVGIPAVACVAFFL